MQPIPSRARISASGKRLLIAVSFAVASTAAAAAKERPAVDEQNLLAKVNQHAISAAEYDRAFAVAVRQKYYHAQVPEREMDALKGEVADSLINRVLLLDEAKRRNIKPDRAAIKRTIAEYDERYGNSEQWKKNRKQMIAAVTPELEAQSKLQRLEETVKAVPPATQEQAKAFYEAHLDLFVEPERVRLSVILLRVDPSSPKATWDKAREEAEGIAARLSKGADFAELARLHSSDSSAERGGDLGYLHRGMLPEGTQGVIDKLSPGAISEPIRLLEGVALVRMEDRQSAQQHPFAEVSARAGDLWRREQGEAQWKGLVAQLREKAVIRINTARYPALAHLAAQDRRVNTP